MPLPDDIHYKHARNLEKSAAIDRANDEIEKLTATGLVTRNEARLVVKFRQLSREGNGLRMMQVIMDGNSPPTFWRLRADGGMLRE